MWKTGDDVALAAIEVGAGTQGECLPERPARCRDSGHDGVRHIPPPGDRCERDTQETVVVGEDRPEEHQFVRVLMSSHPDLSGHCMDASYADQYIALSHVTIPSIEKGALK
jgi:hypothetical protein